MKDKHLVILFICILQLEALKSISVRALEDLNTYSEVSSTRPANLTCFPSTDSPPSAFIPKLSRFWLVVNEENENKRKNYFCRQFFNISEMRQLQYRQMVMDIKINETLSGYLKPGVCSCVPIAALMPLLGVLAVSIILNIHLLLRKRHGPKKKRLTGLKASDDDSGSDESLIDKKEPPGVVITDDLSKDGEPFKMNKNVVTNNWLHPPFDRRRRLGSTESPLEERKTRLDSITKYEIPSISFDDGPILSPQTSMFGSEEDMQLNESSVFQPDISVKRVPYYPVDESSVIMKNTNQGFETNGDSKDDDLSVNNKPGNDSVVNVGSQVETNFNIQDSGGIEYHLPAQNDDVYNVHSEDSITLENEQSLAENSVSQLDRDAKDDLVNSANQSSKDEVVDTIQVGTSPLHEDSPVASEGFVPEMSFDDLKEEQVADGNAPKLDTDYERFQPDMSLSGRDVFQPFDDIPVSNAIQVGTSPLRENSPVASEGFVPKMSFDDLKEEHVADGNAPKLDTDYERFQPDMSLSGRDVFQPLDDIPVSSSRANRGGFQPHFRSYSPDVESPNCCIPSFYNDDDEGFQPVMSLNDRENILEDNSIPKIDNFGFQPEICLHERDEDLQNDTSSEAVFPYESSKLNTETSPSPSHSTFEPSLKCGGNDYPLEADTKEDPASEEYCLDPLNKRQRSNTIEEYNIPTIPLGEDSMDVPVISTSAATANLEGCDDDDDKEKFVPLGAPGLDCSLRTDSFA